MQKHQICPICTKIVEVIYKPSLDSGTLKSEANIWPRFVNKLRQFGLKLTKLNIFVLRRVDLLFEESISMRFEHFDFFRFTLKSKL